VGWAILIIFFANLLQYLRTKNYQNKIRFDKVIAKIKGAIFLPHGVEWCGYLLEGEKNEDTYYIHV